MDINSLEILQQFRRAQKLAAFCKDDELKHKDEEGRIGKCLGALDWQMEVELMLEKYPWLKETYEDS